MTGTTREQRREYEGIYAASDAAGEYIGKLGKTDFAEWTEEEWLTFVETIVSVAKINDVPF